MTFFIFFLIESRHQPLELLKRLRKPRRLRRLLVLLLALALLALPLLATEQFSMTDQVFVGFGRYLCNVYIQDFLRHLRVGAGSILLY